MLKFSKPIFFIRRIFIRKYILGIETSCDDTGTAIVDRNGKLISEHVESQIKITSSVGGVIPTVARQLHMANIEPCVKNVMDSAGLSFSDLSAIALTVKPGLGLSLATGRDYAVDKAKKYKLPIIPIHHMEAHALVVRMLEPNVDFPFMVLLISGGNSILGVAHSVEDFSLFGTRLDMSPGDCLDKIARMLSLVGKDGSHSSVSGGRAIEILANENRKELLDFVPCRQHSRDCEFSFSGVEGSVTGYLERSKKNEETVDIPQICASVQYSMAFQMCRRVQRGMMYCHSYMKTVPTSLVVSGGVASNLYFRACFQKVCQDFEYRLICPPVKYCTDNGAMIAWNGYELLRLGKRIVRDVSTIDYTRRAHFGVDMRQHVLDKDIRLPKLKLKDVVNIL